jgi:hypothetical protein
MDEKTLINKFSNTIKIQNEDTLRINLFGYITEIILSKVIFKNNKDLSNFFDMLNINHKKYLYASRTLLIAKTVRIIQVMDKGELFKTRDLILKYLFQQFPECLPNNIEKTNLKSKNGDYVDSMIKKYSRSK